MDIVHIVLHVRVWVSRHFIILRSLLFYDVSFLSQGLQMVIEKLMLQMVDFLHKMMIIQLHFLGVRVITIVIMIVGMWLLSSWKPIGLVPCELVILKIGRHHFGWWLHVDMFRLLADWEIEIFLPRVILILELGW